MMLILGFTCFALCNNEEILRRFPSNIYFYIFFSVSMSYILAVVCAVTNPTIVFQALCGTTIITVILTVFALQTKYDYTSWAPVLLISLIIIIFGSILCAYNVPLISIGLIVVGLLVFMLYLIIDVQMIVGGRHIRYEFSEDDYVLAALCLYLDIINIFTHLLQLLNRCHS